MTWACIKKEKKIRSENKKKCQTGKRRSSWEKKRFRNMLHRRNEIHKEDVWEDTD